MLPTIVSVVPAAARTPWLAPSIDGDNHSPSATNGSPSHQPHARKRVNSDR